MSFVHDNLMFIRFIDKRFTYSPLPLHTGTTLGLRRSVVWQASVETHSGEANFCYCSWP